MLKIGILTFHNNENRGAVLQAYGLYRLLGEVFDANVEIVEYRTQSKEWSRKRSTLITNKLWTVPDRIHDRRIVEGFFDTKLPTSDESIITDDHNEAVTWLSNQGYDALVTGSDEIWKVEEDKKSRIQSFVSPSRPFPNLYFLDESIPGTKFSYAASANRTDLNALSEETIETFRRHLAAYDHISVRDRHTKHIVEKLNGCDVTLVPDPTLMIDIPTPDVETILKSHGVDLDKPILNFHGTEHPVFEKICDTYRERGYQIVTTRMSPYADVEFRGVVTPFEYYSLYQHFDMVVTDSLHSTIFSLKHGTPFVTIDTRSIYQNIESKTYSLLHDFFMLDRHIDAINGDASDFFKNRDALETEPNETQINTRINEIQKRGLKFLDQIEDSL